MCNTIPIPRPVPRPVPSEQLPNAAFKRLESYTVDSVIAQDREEVEGTHRWASNAPAASRSAGAGESAGALASATSMFTLIASFRHLSSSNESGLKTIIVIDHHDSFGLLVRGLASQHTLMRPPCPIQKHFNLSGRDGCLQPETDRFRQRQRETVLVRVPEEHDEDRDSIP